MAFQSQVATFVDDGSTDTQAIVWDTAYASYQVAVGVEVTGANGPVVIEIVSKLSTGVTVRSSAPFDGYVYVLAYEVL